MSPEARKAQLLKHALMVFAEKGLDDAGHADLASSAGVSVPTSFTYFPNRESLVSAVIDEVGRFLIDDFVNVRIDDGQETGADAVNHMLMSFADAIDKYPDQIRIWLQWSASVKADYLNKFLEFYELVLRRIKLIVIRGIKDGSMHPDLDVDTASRIVLSSAHMVAHMKFSGADPVSIQASVDALVFGFFQGYEKRP